MKIVQKFDLDKLAYGMHTYMITEIVFDLIGGGGGGRNNLRKFISTYEHISTNVWRYIDIYALWLSKNKCIRFIKMQK